MPLFFGQPPPDFNNDVVKMLCDNDVNGLKRLYSNGTPITFSDYLKAVDNTDGKVTLNTESIIYLHEIGVMHKHQVMLDGAMMGNVELMKYAESKGEDIFYYKVFIYILSNPQNRAQKYILQRMMHKGLMDHRALSDIHSTKMITDEIYNELNNELIKIKSPYKYSKLCIIPVVAGILSFAYYFLK